MKKSMTTAMCGIITGLSIVLLFVGGFSTMLVYLMPLLASFFMIMLKRSFGTSSAVITYVATSLLSFILVSNKECMLMYVLLFGYYPIIQPSINKIKLKFVRIIVKFLIANISVTVIQLILVYVFMIPFLDSNEGIITIILFALLMNILFVVYDFSLKALYILYERKYEKRIKKYFK